MKDKILEKGDLVRFRCGLHAFVGEESIDAPGIRISLSHYAGRYHRHSHLFDIKAVIRDGETVYDRPY